MYKNNKQVILTTEGTQLCTLWPYGNNFDDQINVEKNNSQDAYFEVFINKHENSSKCRRECTAAAKHKTREKRECQIKTHK